MSKYLTFFLPLLLISPDSLLARRGSGKKRFKINSAKQVTLTLSKETEAEYDLECSQWPKEKGDCPGNFYLGELENLKQKNKVFHMVSVYQPGEIVTDETGTIHNNNTRIRVKKQKKNFDLILSSYEPMSWFVEVEEGAPLGKVHLVSYEPSKVTFQGGKKFPVKKIKNSFNHTWGADNENMELGAAVEMKKVNFDPSIVSTFQGDYSSKSYYEVPFPVSKTVSDQSTQFKKDNISLSIPPNPWEKSSSPKKRSPLRFSFDSASETIYSASNHDVFIDFPGKKSVKLKPAAGIPDLSWLAGLAFYPDSKELFIASAWHAGHHHVFNTKTKQWRIFDISEKGSYQDIVYSKFDNKLYAFYNRGQISAIDSNMNPTGAAWQIGDMVKTLVGPVRGGRNSKVSLATHKNYLLVWLKPNVSQHHPMRGLAEKNLDIDGLALNLKTGVWKTFNNIY